MTRFLSLDGLKYFWQRVKQYVDNSTATQQNVAVFVSEYVGLFNGYESTSLNYRDYLPAKIEDAVSQFDGILAGYEGRKA